MDRKIERERQLPGGRAVIGGLLMALAAVGVFVAVDQASSSPTQAVVVAADDLRAGTILEADDLAVVELDLPEPQAQTTFSSPEDLVGHVTLAAVGAGEILPASAVTSQPRPEGDVQELALRLPRGQVAVGRLKQGELVDVYVTGDDGTDAVARGVPVVQLTVDDGDTLTSDREIEVVVAVPPRDVAALVHALRTGDVTVVRSTFDEPGGDEREDDEPDGEGVP